MNTIRSLLFALCAALFTIVMGLVLLPLLIFPREKLWWFGKAWARGTLCLSRNILQLSYQIEDPHGVLATLKTPVIFASRHESVFETIAYYALLPKSVYVIKKELLLLPFYGWYCRKMGSIALDRTAGARALKSMLHQAEYNIKQGVSLVIFPEGTRVLPHQNVPLKTGVAALYTHCNIPVVPLSVNSGQFWQKNRFVKQRGIVIIKVGQPIAAGLSRSNFMKTLEQLFSARMVID